MKLIHTIPLKLVALSFFIFEMSSLSVDANKIEKNPSFQEIFTDGGYKTVESALDEFEQHFNQQLKLPIQVPPIPFTHYLGSFTNLDGEINDSFEVKFIHEQVPENHFKMNVRPTQYKMDFTGKIMTNTYKLKNGNIAQYTKELIRGFNLLIFERDGWQYVFSIDKKVSDEVTPEILVEIANSIDF